MLKLKPNHKIKYKQKSQKYKQIIQDTVIYIQKYKTLDILTASDVNIYIQSLEKLFIELDNIDVLLNNNNISADDLNRKFEHIKGQLSINFKQFGTKNITDLLEVIFDEDFEMFFDMQNKDIFNIIKYYTNSYKL